MGRVLQGKSADKYDAPAGTIACFAGSLESGWLAPNGALLNIATYPDLYAAIGTTFGGDGVTSFALPTVSALEMCGNAAFTVGIKAFGYAKNTPVLDLDSLAGLKNMPVGAEMMWQKETLPDVNIYGVWLEQDGASFDETLYPELYAHLGSNVLPDMRGEFPRGWDHGVGKDPGRQLGSHQPGSLVANDCGNTPSQPGGISYYDGITDPIASQALMGRDPYSPVAASYPDNTYVFNSFTTGIDNTMHDILVAVSRPTNVAKIFLIKAL